MSEKFDMGYLANFAGLTPEARKFFLQMSEAEWLAWTPRYRAVIDLAGGKAAVLPAIRWYEQALLTALWDAPYRIAHDAETKMSSGKSSKSPHKH